MTRKLWTVAVVVLLVALGACAGEQTEQTGDEQKASLLSVHGLDGMDGAAMVDHLDRLVGDARPADLTASVRADELLLSAGDEEVAVPLPEDRFYVAVAPYADSTHECFYHSLTTCQGELADAQVHVRVVEDGTGEVLLDEDVTTFGNGFAGLWLPRDIRGTLQVTHEGRTGEVAISTDAEAPTCVTTLQLA